MVTPTKRFGLELTRPGFLAALMGDDYDAIDDDAMGSVLIDHNVLSYCVYTVLMDAGLKPRDLRSVHADGNSIAVCLRSRSQAKELRDRCHREVVRYGDRRYRIRLKTRDCYLIAESECLDPEDDAG